MNGAMTAEQILDHDRQLWKRSALRAQSRVEQGESFLSSAMAKTVVLSAAIEAADEMRRQVQAILDCKPGEEDWMEITRAVDAYDSARKAAR